jgi:hypothetical protein
MPKRIRASYQAPRILQLLPESDDHITVAGVKPSAKSLILDLLQSLRGRSMPVRALVGRALFGLPRTACASRSPGCSARLVERDGQGLPAGRGRAAGLARVGGWSSADARALRWNGDWIGVLQAGSARRSPRAAAATRALPSSASRARARLLRPPRQPARERRRGARESSSSASIPRACSR